PAGLLTSEGNVAPPCVFRTMSPAVVFVMPLTTVGPLMSSAIPFEAEATRIGVVAVTGAPGAPIAPAEEDRKNEPPVTTPLPVRFPVEVTVTEPVPALTAPPSVIAPPLLSVTLPPPFMLTPRTVRAPALLNTTSPPALLAVKEPTLFAPVRVVPPTETVARTPVVEIVAPLSLRGPPATRLMGPPPDAVMPRSGPTAAMLTAPGESN